MAAGLSRRGIIKWRCLLFCCCCCAFVGELEVPLADFSEILWSTF